MKKFLIAAPVAWMLVSAAHANPILPSENYIPPGQNTTWVQGIETHGVWSGPDGGTKLPGGVVNSTYQAYADASKCTGSISCTGGGGGEPTCTATISCTFGSFASRPGTDPWEPIPFNPFPGGTYPFNHG